MAAQVVRVWKGYGTADGVERYCGEHFPKMVLPQLREIAGFIGARVLVRAVDNETEVVVATMWKSLEAVKAFAGDDYERAVVEPVVRELLVRFDERVTHFTVALAT
jgi:heme-degrading monooxygenase HmoA